MDFADIQSGLKSIRTLLIQNQTDAYEFILVGRSRLARLAYIRHPSGIDLKTIEIAQVRLKWDISG